MANNIPKVCYKDLNGFEILTTDEKIKTESFLSASEEIVQVIDTFGRLFTPVTMDMRNNIRKLNAIYEKNPDSFAYIEHITKPEYIGSIDALIWLKRALNLILIFFKNILNDTTTSENLKEHLKDAYEKTLKHHHGLIVKHTVTMIYRWVPKRSELLGSGELHEENTQILNSQLERMEQHLERINILLNDFPK